MPTTIHNWKLGQCLLFGTDYWDILIRVGTQCSYLTAAGGAGGGWLGLELSLFLPDPFFLDRGRSSVRDFINSDSRIFRVTLLYMCIYSGNSL